MTWKLADAKNKFSEGVDLTRDRTPERDVSL